MTQSGERIFYLIFICTQVEIFEKKSDVFPLYFKYICMHNTSAIYMQRVPEMSHNKKAKLHWGEEVEGNFPLMNGKKVGLYYECDQHLYLKVIHFYAGPYLT